MFPKTVPCDPWFYQRMASRLTNFFVPLVLFFTKDFFGPIFQTFLFQFKKGGVFAFSPHFFLSPPYLAKDFFTPNHMGLSDVAPFVPAACPPFGAGGLYPPDFFFSFSCPNSLYFCFTSHFSQRDLGDVSKAPFQRVTPLVTFLRCKPPTSFFPP